MTTDLKYIGTTLGFGLASGLYMGSGLARLHSYISEIDSLRDAVYAHADKITPEIIKEADDLVSKVSKGDIFTALLDFGLGFTFAVASYYMAREGTSRHQNRRL